MVITLTNGAVTTYSSVVTYNFGSIITIPALTLVVVANVNNMKYTFNAYGTAYF